MGGLVLPCLLLATTLLFGCGEGSGPGTPDGGPTPVGAPVEGTGEVVAAWPGGQEVRVTALRMEAEVPCATAGPGASPGGEICDVVITAEEGSERRLAISIPSAALASGQTVSLNDARLARVEVRRADGEVATSTSSPPTRGAIVFGEIQIRPTLKLSATFVEDSHLTGRTASGGLIDVTVAGSVMFP